MGLSKVKQQAVEGTVKAGLAFMALHIFFNIVTLLNSPQKTTDAPMQPNSPMHKYSCETPVIPQVPLEIFSALGMNPANNPFAKQPVQQPTPCPQAPQPLT